MSATDFAEALYLFFSSLEPCAEIISEPMELLLFRRQSLQPLGLCKATLVYSSL